MTIKRWLAAALCLLMILPAGRFAAAENGFVPAPAPQNLYRVVQPICGRRELVYRDGYRTGQSVTYSQAVAQTPVEHLAMYMNVYVDSPTHEVADLMEQTRYRQIDIQRLLDGTYYEVRWYFSQFSLQKGWNRLLLLFDPAGEAPVGSQEMTVAAANKQNILFSETASFNFALTLLKEEGACDDFTIILDDVAIVDTSRPVNEAVPVAPPYYPLQAMGEALPDQELYYEGTGYHAAAQPFAPGALAGLPAESAALFMNLYVEDLTMLYHLGPVADGRVDRRLTLTDQEGNAVVWEKNAFDALDLRVGWNAVVWRLSDSAGLLDGVPRDGGSWEALDLDGPLLLALDLNGTPSGSARIQIAGAALVDVSRRADGSPYYDTAYDLLHFSEADGTYTATGQPLTTGAIFADGCDAATGVDLSRHNPAGLRLTATVTLHADGEIPRDFFRRGSVALSAVDGSAGEWSLRILPLSEGVNRLSLRLDELPETLDLSAVNRLTVTLTGPADHPDPVSMTLQDVRIVDIAGRREGQAYTVDPAEGMDADDRIVYNLNAAEWGADPTGEDDSTLAIQECLDTLQAHGGVVFLPVGRYRVDGTLSVPAGVTLRGEWVDPTVDPARQGTLLMAYYGAGDPDATPFITIRGASCLRDLAVWYPEQDPVDPVPYPPTVFGQGHTVVKRVTMINAYTGFYNASCSSMLIRDFYGTVLYQGIYGANAYDIPRIERVSLSTRYWIESGLPGAPAGLAADRLISHARQTVTGLIGGRQDWGYWYDIDIENAKIGIFLYAGNDAVGDLTTRHVQYGIYTTNVNAPGLQITHSDISATVECVHYQVDFRQTLVASATTFRDAPVGIHTISKGPYGVSLQDCVFRNWEEYAVVMDGGHLTAANNRFEDEKPAFLLDEAVPQALLTGNVFAAPGQALEAGESTFVQRDDDNHDVPVTPDYRFEVPQTLTPANGALFLVTDYGARADGDRDNTAAIQAALDDAAQAGGGTVYVPGGIYRVDGALSVPDGVELRGSFDGAHYGNSCFTGTQLFARGGKNDPDGDPLITLGKNAGVKGLTVFYPEQGIYDEERGEWVCPYPVTIRANAGCWIENVAMVNAYDGIDAITERCDGLLIRDVTGTALHDTLWIGHGMRGGTIHNLHLNPSGWSYQYGTRPQGWFDNYANAHSTYLVLGDCEDLQIFSCFNIIIATQTRLIKDPYTGGCFHGTTWGIAYDASHDGIIAEGGIDAELTMIATMGVFNQRGGGYNVITKPGFTGKIALFNGDSWGSNSMIARVEGGTVTIAQYLSMCTNKGVCRDGELNFYTGVFTSRSGDNSGRTPDLTYEEGGSGQVIGNLDCERMFNLTVEPGARVDDQNNGLPLDTPRDVMTFSGAAGQTADTGWVRWDGRADSFDLTSRDGRNLRLWLDLQAKEDVTLTVALRSRGDEEEHTAYWTVTLPAGVRSLNLPLEELTDGEPGLDRRAVDRLRITADRPVTVGDARIVDLTPLYRQKQALYTAWLAQPVAVDGYTPETAQSYLAALEEAEEVYRNGRADEAAIAGAAKAVEEAMAGLVPLPTRLAGDVNGDGAVTAEDALQALQAATGKIVLTDEDAAAARITGGAEVTAADALMILQLATGKVVL
ncbi:MAG: glycosyl hydrolase family 28-related protein [Acutalibacteraceae bacterium]